MNPTSKRLTEAVNPIPPKANINPVAQQAAPLVTALNAEEPTDYQDLSRFNLGGSGGDVEQYEQTDYPVFNYKTLALYIDFAYQTKDPLLIYGQPGLGKSDIVRSYCEDAAKDKGKVYKNWNKCTANEKIAILQNPEKYFVLIDIRTAQLEPADLIGIPDIGSSQAYLETKQPKWIYYMSLPNSDGILFLDELNQGAPQVLKALYEVVLDKSAGGTPLSHNFVVIGAGNLGAEHGNEPIPQALTNRFTAGVLIADPKSWIEWAEANRIDKYIIAFVKSNPSDNFYTKPINPDDPFPTPRQMQKLTNSMNHIYKTYTEAAKNKRQMNVPFSRAVADAAAAKCGVFWARKFMTFLKHIQAFNLNHIMKNAEGFNKEAADKLHALVVFLTGKLKYCVKNIAGGQTQDPLTTQVLMTVIYVTAHLKREWSTILWTNISKSFSAEEKKEIFQGINATLKNPNIPKDIVTKCINTIKNDLPDIFKGE